MEDKKYDLGDAESSDGLLLAVYDDLRRLAKYRLAKESAHQTLQPTALVHEAFLRLTKDKAETPKWDGRAHFFAAIAEVMRRILVENARRKKRLKRGGGMNREEIDPANIPAPDPDLEVIALDEAIEQLAALKPRWAELVKLRYYAGMTIPEAASVLGVAPRTADAWWAESRRWLQNVLKSSSD